MSPVHRVIDVIDVVMVVYLVGLNSGYTLLFVLGSRDVWRYVERRGLRNYTAIADSELALPVSVLMPAYNEEPLIAEAVSNMLRLNYRSFEVVVINDGSSDDTLARLREHFRLVRVRRVPRCALHTQDVRGVYLSADDERLVVIDKYNGGKADSLNAGLRYARYPLFCAIDADTLLDRDALPRLVWAFQTNPYTVAVGGIVRIINGCHVADAHVSDVRAPGSALVRVQIVEYLRAFLLGRSGWSRLGMLLIVSGAFGMFRRELVIEAGGYATDTVGEDAELVVRLHRHCRKTGQQYKLSFIADPVCWTQAPSSPRVLARQRDRWQRGLVETVWRHRAMIANPRSGTIGLAALPFVVLFEVLGPVIQLLGYLAFTLTLLAGWVSPQSAAILLILGFGYGMLHSLGAVYVEERSFQRYSHRRDVLGLLRAAVAENLGYRQWQTVVRARAFVSLARGRRAWGEMTRAGFATDRLQTTLLSTAAPTTNVATADSVPMASNPALAPAQRPPPAFSVVER